MDVNINDGGTFLFFILSRGGGGDGDQQSTEGDRRIMDGILSGNIITSENV